MVADGDGPTIIYPPPEVRNIVDKTASFVARNGVEFEQRIKQNEINNPKFNFLNGGDPYHAYYQYKVDAIREGKVEPEPVAKVQDQSQVTSKQSELLKSVRKEETIVPKEPPAEFEFLADPPSISAFDLDVVKLTAQFVARNGRQFLTQLMNREQRNFQFDFLRPQHSLFQYFTKLLEQYTKVLIPPKDLQMKLENEALNKDAVLDQVRYRVAWLKQQEANRRRQEEAIERERVSYAQVDWHNFVVVETVDYQPWEVGNFPPPTNPSEVGARVLIQRRQEEHGVQPPQPSYNDSDESDDETGADTNLQDMEEGSSEEGSDDEGGAPRVKQVMAAPPVQQPMAPPIQAPLPGNVTIRKYDPKAAAAIKKKSNDDQYLISPITGEKVPAKHAAEHMKVGLLDPRWVEDRDKQITQKQNEEVVYAPGQSIEASLRNMAERRTDIFGVGDEAAQETMIGKKIGEHEIRDTETILQSAAIDNTPVSKPPPPEPPKSVVAAPAPVVSAIVPPVAPMIVGVPMRPAMVVPAPVFAPAPPPVFIQQSQMLEDDEPSAKRSRTEENLIPEEIFMARNPSTVTMQVSVPSVPDKPEWKLEGQMLSITLSLSDTVNSVKSKIMEELGMPQGKQKLQHDTIFLKVIFSLRQQIIQQLAFPGRELSGLLQHPARDCPQPTTERERRTQEIIVEQ